MPTPLKDLKIPRLDAVHPGILARVIDIGSEHPDWSVRKCIWRAIRRRAVLHGLALTQINPHEETQA